MQLLVKLAKKQTSKQGLQLCFFFHLTVSLKKKFFNLNHNNPTLSCLCRKIVGNTSRQRLPIQLFYVYMYLYVWCLWDVWPVILNLSKQTFFLFVLLFWFKILCIGKRAKQNDSFCLNAFLWRSLDCFRSITSWYCCATLVSQYNLLALWEHLSVNCTYIHSCKL